MCSFCRKVLNFYNVDYFKSLGLLLILSANLLQTTNNATWNTVNIWLQASQSCGSVRNYPKKSKGKLGTHRAEETQKLLFLSEQWCAGLQEPVVKFSGTL